MSISKKQKRGVSMTNNSTNPNVDFYFDKDRKWQEEIKKLRTIVLDSPLTEELKWGVPCYTLEQNNILLIHVFKEYCAILFVNGVLLKDPHGLLIQQTEDVQAGRQIRFANMEDIIKTEAILKVYINEAIEIEKSGLKVEFKKKPELTI